MTQAPLDGRVAIVTGASKGIGRAIAEGLGRLGASVAVNYLTDGDSAVEVADAIRAEGSMAVPVHADVSVPDQVSQMVDTVVAELGPPTILVNNAAIFPWRDWQQIDLDEWDRVFAVNVRGPYTAVRAIYPHMSAARHGRIISIASATFLTGSAELMHYASSKGALVGLTRSLARALGDEGITVNAVSTGRTLTDGYQRWIDDGTVDFDETVASRQSQCIKRLGTPDDVVGAVGYLASDSAEYITGQLINVDGGRNMY